MQHFTASDGVRIAYRDKGTGRPLVLLHGLMAHSGFFAGQDELAGDFRLIAVDLRGHGRSKSDGSGPTVERLSVDVAELLDSLGIGNAVGIGWSLGASVLWRLLAGPSTDRFAGAVIVDMTPRVLNDGEWSLGLTGETCEARRAAIRDDYSSFAVNAGHAIFAQPVSEGNSALARWSGEQFALNDARDMAALWESLVGEDSRSALGSIRQPTLVIHGAHSQLYGSGTADHLVAALPDARAVRFDRSGHAPHMEQPELFNRLVREFAHSLPSARMPEITA